MFTNRKEKLMKIILRERFGLQPTSFVFAASLALTGVLVAVLYSAAARTTQAADFSSSARKKTAESEKTWQTAKTKSKTKKPSGNGNAAEMDAPAPMRRVVSANDDV